MKNLLDKLDKLDNSVILQAIIVMLFTGIWLGMFVSAILNEY